MFILNSIYSYLPTWMQPAQETEEASSTIPLLPNQTSSKIELSSITTASGVKEEMGLFAPPTLSSPLLVIQLMENVYSTGGKLLEAAVDELKSLSGQIQNNWQQIVENMQKNTAWTQQTDMWSTLQTVGAYILSAYSVAMGGTIYASGSPVLGATLIAAGLLSTTNIALTEMGGWNYIAEKLAKENKELQEQITFWGPMTLYALSLTGSIAISYDPSTLANVPSLDWKKFIESMNSTVIAGKGFASANLEWSKASLLQLQTTLFTDNLARDVLLEWIKSFTQMLEHGWEQARNIILISTQMKA